MCAASVTMARRASTHAAGMPFCSSAAAMMRLLINSPVQTIASWALGDAARRIAVALSSARRSSSSAAISTSTSLAASAGSSRSIASKCRRDSSATPLRTCASRRRSADSVNSRSRSVTPLIAETITTGGRPELSRASLTIPTTRVMASASATELPPNFMTMGPVSRTLGSDPGRPTARSGSDPGTVFIQSFAFEAPKT